MITDSKPARQDSFIFAIVVGVPLAVYALTLAPTVLFADGGEFQFVPWLPGIAHPTGYPLYTLAGWLFSHLYPFGQVAWRLNFFSALTGALAVGIVYLIAGRLTTSVFSAIPRSASRISAITSALIFAFSATFWSQAIIAEVYSLHALFVALILWACLRITAPTESDPSSFSKNGGYLLAFLFGLSLTHHSTIVLMVPAVVLYLWLIGWRKISVKEGFYLALLVALPILLYLYLPIIAPSVPYTSLNLSQDRVLTLYDNSVSGFLYHILAGVFASDIQPRAVNLDRLSLSLSFLRQQVGWLGILLSWTGIYSLRRHYPLLLLTLVGFISFFIFNLIYFIGDVYVLFVPCWLILSLWIGLGWLALTRFITNKFVERKRARVRDNPMFARATERLETRMQQLLIITITSLGLIYPIGLFITRYTEINQAENFIARDAWEEILDQQIPEGAILLSNDRNEIMPMWYYQYVEGHRLDLQGLFPLISDDPGVANIGQLLDEALASGRPVYLVKPMPGLEVKADLKALPPGKFSQLVQVSRPKLTPDTPYNLDFGDGLNITGYDLMQSESTITVTLYWQPSASPPVENLTSYLHLVDSNGIGVTQSHDHQIGGIYYPTTLWSPGEVLRDEHTLTLPPDLPPGEYSLVAGLYFHTLPGVIENYGSGQTLTTWKNIN